MNVNKAEITISAVSKAQYPMDNRPEIAFVGRSNVGKSSLINTLVNRKALARTSSQPGKTRVINFFNIEDKIYFVDLPGYGYAKVSKAEKEKWGKMIEEYLRTREQLVAIVMLVDLRHEPSKDDIQMFEWLKHFGYKTIVVCTKSDKLSRNEANKNLFRMKKILNLREDDDIVPFSSENRQGKEELWKILDDVCRDEDNI